MQTLDEAIGGYLSIQSLFLISTPEITAVTAVRAKCCFAVTAVRVL